MHPNPDTRIVYVSAPNWHIESSLNTYVQKAGFTPRHTGSLPAMARHLADDTTAIGLVRVGTADMAAAACATFRKDGVTNLLFFLIDRDGDPASLAWSMAKVLRSGADEVQPAPIDGGEFAARLQAIARRNQTYYDHLTVDLPNGAVFYPERSYILGKAGRVSLPRSECLVLWKLARTTGIVTRRQIMEDLYFDDGPQEKVIDVWITKIRGKVLPATGGVDVIRTAWGQGFEFVKEGFEPTYRLTKWRRTA